ncbi:MAG: CxxxxCH/CxxCH domain-containing protein, partial [Desulfatitalea sp.]|nr:CxxxxCH/CxxCH domain-containing protein [Desulfatitalea sp.]
MSFLTAAAALIACSNPNVEAPPAGQVHVSGYMASHSAEAAEDINRCKSCHGNDLRGGSNAPSCFSATFTNADGTITGCHTGGSTAGHDASFMSPDRHGVEAKVDLTACQACHGTPGTTAFDGGTTGVSCATAACHNAAGAHPTRWQGSNDITNDYLATHRNAANTDTSCAICHDVVPGSPIPNPDAPSCFSAEFTNADGATSGCHTTGPTVGHDMPYDTAALHGPAAKADLTACQACHGTAGTTAFDGGNSGVSCATAACHSAAGAHPTRWQGSNDITDDYPATHRNAASMSTSCAICHDVAPGGPMPNPNAPSCFSAAFTNADGTTSGCHDAGPSALHPLPFIHPGQHGADAKNNLSGCAPCHAIPADAGAGDNPRFNKAIGSLTNGCEDCHAANTAHPTPLWTGAAASHRTAGHMDTSCALCHGTNLNGPADGGIAAACVSCHTAGSPLVETNCLSCHNRPPDAQAPMGNQHPNRDGSHTLHNALPGVSDNCAICHEGAGTGTDAHFAGGNPTPVALSANYNAQSGDAAYNSTSQTCATTRCHGGQTSPDWYNGTLNVDTDCESCHTTSSDQYNSPRSGRHEFHLAIQVNIQDSKCIFCHDPALLASKHFSNLQTTTFEGNPWETLRDDLAYNHNTRMGCNVFPYY